MFAPKTLTRPALLIALCLVVLFGQGELSHGQNPPLTSFNLTLLHTNDLHGHIFPFAYTETERSKNEVASVGGAARRATLVRRLRRETKNPVLLLDSGDTFTRGPLTNAYEGIADVEAMNAVGYDLAALGNNEFKAKDGYEINDAPGAQSALLQVVKRSHFHWLCANAKDDKKASLEGVLPYVVREIQGVKVGFLGLTAPRVATYPQARGWTISDPISTAKEWIPIVRRHCDILIAMTHIGVDLDKQLAAETAGIDAIVGGDSHTFLYKALEVANTEGKKIPIVQAGEFGVNLGRFDLHFLRANTGQWTLADFTSQLIPVGADIPEAPDVVAALQPYLLPMLKVVGHLDKANIGATPAERLQKTNQFIVDAMRHHSGADYALHKNDNLFEFFRRTTVTRYDVFAIMPFKNYVVEANLTGAEIQNLQKKVTNTVLSGNKEALDPAKTYKVAFADFAASSVFKLPADRLTNTHHDLREVVISYLH